MLNLSFCFPYILLWIIPLGLSIFYGARAADIFDVKTGNNSLSQKIHQFWFNFGGSLFGWVILYFLSLKTYQHLVLNPPIFPDAWDALTLFISFIGISGHLPYTTWNVINSIRGLMDKLISSIPDKK